MTEKNFVAIESNRIALSFEPDGERMTAIRVLAQHHGGAQIKTGGGVWTCTLPLTARDEVAKLFVSLKWSEDFRRMMNGSAAKLQPAAGVVANRFLAAAGDLTKPLEDGRTLYLHQKDGIKWLLETPRAILADDMGLGKTIQSLIAAKAIYEASRAHTVVITKACLIADWRDEAAKLKHRVVSCYSWAKIPKPAPGQHYVLIADEAQFAQNTTSKRGKAFLEWAEASDFVYMLTGTPMMNGRHLNLFPLIKALRHPLAADRHAYEKKFCGARRVVLSRDFKIDDERFTISFRCKACGTPNELRWNAKWKWYNCVGCNERHAAPKSYPEKNGANCAPELKAALAPFILRRLKTQCLDLPPKTRVIRDVEVTHDMQTTYDAAVRLARETYARRVADGTIQKAGAPLAILSIVRVAASLAKAQAAIELAEEALEEGSQPIIFTEFLDSVAFVSKHFKITPYIGDTKTDRKTEIVKDFQAGRQRLFVGTREAGGTGLNLTAANVVILNDRPLRPGDVDQAEDRLYRIGQNWPVTSYWLRAFPICHKIDGFLERKQKAIEALLGAGNQIETKLEDTSARELLGELFDWAKK